MKKLNKKNPLYIEDLNNILSIKQYCVKLIFNRL